MPDRETADAIDERAAAWVARLDHDGEEGLAADELRLWLDGDPRRRGAFVRAQAAWLMLDRASALGSGGFAPEAPAALPWFSRRRAMAVGGGAMAASLVAGAAFWGVRDLRDGKRIDTALGEIRQVPLGDGSLAAVNTDSSINVALHLHVRRIALRRGEAWFEVAHDHTRPFIVEAGDVRVRAVGTAFSVRRKSTGVDVLVTEGVVESWSEQDPDRRERIVAGDRAFVSDAGGPGVPIAASVQNDRELAWRSGELIFEGETVTEAAEQFNRYNQLKIDVSDPAVGGERVIGRFRTNEPDTFARTAVATLGVAMHQTGNVIVLSQP